MHDASHSTHVSEREARRAVLHDALVALGRSEHPDEAADDVLRALDAYVSTSRSALEPREPPVARYERTLTREGERATWATVAGAAIATAVVAATFSGGWLALLAVVAIWAVALVIVLAT